MADPRLNEALKWSIQNSDTSRNDPSSQGTRSQGLSAEALAALLGGPSDADLMREAMAAIQSPEVDLDNKLTAFDNFEQLIENLDNANNMESLGLWMPLVQQLGSDEAELRRMAAWCVGTAVQNNVKAQERVSHLESHHMFWAVLTLGKLHAVGAIPTIAKLAVNDPSQAVRKKAILALSSGIRNYQPGLDAATKSLPDEHRVENVNAADMEAVDGVIQKLRDESQKRA